MRKRLVIAVLSNANGWVRRQRCRRMWFDALRDNPDVTPFFVVGTPPAVRGGIGDAFADEPDLVRLPCPDDYGHLSIKTKQFLDWVMPRFDFDYVFKCDDDTYAQPDRLLAYRTDGRPYIGIDYGSIVRIQPYAHGGAGYFLSRPAAELAAASVSTTPTSAEDLSVGVALQRHGIRVHHDGRFRFNWEPPRLPLPSNEMITAHYVNSDERMRFILEQWE